MKVKIFPVNLGKEMNGYKLICVADTLKLEFFDDGGVFFF